MIILWISSHQRFIHRETGRDGRAEQSRDGIRWETAPPKTNRTHTDTKPISIQLMILSYRGRFSLLSSSLVLSGGFKKTELELYQVEWLSYLKTKQIQLDGDLSAAALFYYYYFSWLTDWLTDSVRECVCGADVSFQHFVTFRLPREFARSFVRLVRCSPLFKAGTNNLFSLLAAAEMMSALVSKRLGNYSSLLSFSFLFLFL